MAVLGAVVVALFAVLGAIITAPNFDVFMIAWVPLFKNLTNAAIVAAYSSGSAYILKNLLTDSQQNFLGIPTKS